MQWLWQKEGMARVCSWLCSGGRTLEWPACFSGSGEVQTRYNQSLSVCSIADTRVICHSLGSENKWKVQNRAGYGDVEPPSLGGSFKAQGVRQMADKLSS